jgi:RNA polymerase sigma factor (sigma-70 family)
MCGGFLSSETMSKVLHLAPTAASREEVFMARYERLRGWASHLSDGDQIRADDLVQEAFIQFTLSGADLAAIRNLDAYLFGLLRIIHLSQLRRSKQRAHILRTILDYDAAVLGLRAADPRGQFITREQLQRVCQYACARKESSKAGSVLLLRFFLGYYPSEIAQICGCTRPAVEERLRLARAEAKAYLDDPDFLKVIGGDLPAVAVRCDLTQPVDAFLRDLRNHIYRSRSGRCLSARQWKSFYGEGSAADCATLSHLSSCPDCLGAVNEILGLPALEERHPIDSLGKKTRDKDGGGDGPTGGAGGGGYEARRCRQRARETVEHNPQELCVAVNGHDVGSQVVGGPHNEQTFNVAEGVEFVEVFSEQEVRLLLLHVNEPPPDGPFRHSARVRLSDGRVLEANLDLNYPSSTVQVIYQDPAWRPEAAGTVVEAGASTLIDLSSGGESSLEAKRRGTQEGFRDDRSRGVWARLRLLLAGWRPWLRPGTVAAVLSLLLVAALFFVRWRGAEVSAAELLARAALAERTQAGDRSSAVKRVFYLEQTGKGGVVSARRRVEVWQSASRALTVRRVYDENDQPVIAEAVRADGSRTVVSPGSQDSTSKEARPRPSELLEAGALWRLEPSAEVFLDLTGRAVNARVEEGADRYTVSYRRGVAAASEAPGDLAEAVLVVRKADLHGVELRVAVGRGGDEREYRFIETEFTRRPEASVPDSVFEIGGARVFAPTSGGERPSAPAASSPGATAAAPVRASAELEVEVNYLLHKIKAGPGEQITVERTPDDRLRVEAVAETKERKAEILKALGGVVGNPAVEIEVSTIAEALRQRGPGQTTPTSVLDVEVTDDARDVDAELRRHYAQRAGGEALTDEAILRLSGRVIGYSRRAVQHAVALKRLSASFSPGKSGALEAPAREKLLAMIRAHVQGYVQNVEALRQELLPLASGGAADEGRDAAAVTDDAETARAVERLLQLSRSNDEAVRSAFALSSQGESLALVKSPAFWNSLASAAALSRAILRAYQK